MIDDVRLNEGLTQLGFRLGAVERGKFATFAGILHEESGKLNLTRVPKEQYVERHFLDSLSMGSGFFNGASTLLDVGSGAGFPGIPIAISCPDLQVVLLEATGKRVSFLRSVASACALGNLEVLQGRAEELAHDQCYREKFDRVVARAVARLITLAELTIPYAKVGGLLAYQKGEEAKVEYAEAAAVITELGGQLSEIRALQPHKHLIVLSKVKGTPNDRPTSYARMKQREERIVSKQ